MSFCFLHQRSISDFPSSFTCEGVTADSRRFTTPNITRNNSAMLISVQFRRSPYTSRSYPQSPVIHSKARSASNTKELLNFLLPLSSSLRLLPLGLLVFRPVSRTGIAERYAVEVSQLGCTKARNPVILAAVPVAIVEMVVASAGVTRVYEFAHVGGGTRLS